MELDGAGVEAGPAVPMERGLGFHAGERSPSLIVPPPKPIPAPRVRTGFAAAAA